MIISSLAVATALKTVAVVGGLAAAATHRIASNKAAAAPDEASAAKHRRVASVAAVAGATASAASMAGGLYGAFRPASRNSRV